MSSLKHRRALIWCITVIGTIALFPLLSGPWDPKYYKSTTYSLSGLTPVDAIVGSRSDLFPAFQVGGGILWIKISGIIYDSDPDTLLVGIHCGLKTDAYLDFNWSGVKVYEWNSEAATKGNLFGTVFVQPTDNKLIRSEDRSSNRLELAASAWKKPLYFEIPVSAASGEALVLGFLAAPDWF